MLLFPLFMLLSFGLVVILIGLTGVSYAKRRELGLGYKIVAYLTATCGIVVVVGGIAGAIMLSSCHGSCGKHKMKFHTEMHGDCGKSKCKKSDSCDEKGKSCKSKCKKTIDDEGNTFIEKEVIIEKIEDAEDVAV